MKLCDAILNYAEAANMSIITRVLDLPRELRNEIYDVLLAPDHAKHFAPCFNLIFGWRNYTQFRGPWLARNLDDGPEHFFHPRFVGMQFTTEILERFRDTIGQIQGWPIDDSHVHVRVDVADINLFLDRNRFGVGLSMEELTRDITLIIDFNYSHLYLGTSQPYDMKGLSFSEMCDAASIIPRILCTEQTNRQSGNDYSRSPAPRAVNLVIRTERSPELDNRILTPIARLVVSIWYRLLAGGCDSSIHFTFTDYENIEFPASTQNWTLEDWNENWEIRFTEDEKRELEEVFGETVENFELIWQVMQETILGESR
jgi:hypothetical protein